MPWIHFIEHRELSFGYSELVSCHRIHASKLFSSLQALHTDDPLTWDYVARRELQIQPQPGEEQPATKQARALEMGRKEDRCCAVYEEAVQTLPTGELHQTTVHVEVMVFVNGKRSAHSHDQVAFRNLSGSLQCAWLSNLFFLWW